MHLLILHQTTFFTKRVMCVNMADKIGYFLIMLSVWAKL